jgi:hypothetical protein
MMCLEMDKKLEHTDQSIMYFQLTSKVTELQENLEFHVRQNKLLGDKLELAEKELEGYKAKTQEYLWKYEELEKVKQGLQDEIKLMSMRKDLFYFQGEKVQRENSASSTVSKQQSNYYDRAGHQIQVTNGIVNLVETIQEMSFLKLEFQGVSSPADQSKLE